MSLLLDTNVVSELRKVTTGRPDPRFADWANRIDGAVSYLSVVTILEFEQGVLRLHRRDPIRADALRLWLERSVLQGFSGRILPIDIAIAKRCAGLHVPQTRSERDAFIAATALVHGLTVVTRNVADFAPTGVAVINPWEP